MGLLKMCGKCFFAKPFLDGAAVAALVLMLGVSMPVSAQNAPGGPGASPPAKNVPAENAPAENVKIPAAVLSGLLTGSPEALLALKQYLAEVAASPSAVSRRALDVVRQLKESGLVRDPSLIIIAAERVARSVRDTLASTKIIKLKVDRTFKPPAGTIALDFATADARVREGFTKVLATDPMLDGKQIQAIRRPGDDTDLLADGVVGVEKISLAVPDGEYRVTLMTESIGDAATSLAPFGQSITADGQKIDVLQAAPDAWLNQAVLSNRGLEGFKSTTARQGGAMTMTVKVTGGKLDLGFNFESGGGLLKTYLTGMLVEPVTAPPLVTPIAAVRDALETPRAEQERYESQIATSISSLLEETVTEAGNLDDISQPVQTVQEASPS